LELILKDCAERIQAVGGIVVAVVSDNASNMTAAIRQFRTHVASWIFPVRCAAHTLNLVPKELFEDRSSTTRAILSHAFVLLDSVLTRFMSSADLRERLPDVQRAALKAPSSSFSRRRLAETLAFVRWTTF
jgi:hypothetical protein